MGNDWNDCEFPAHQEQIIDYPSTPVIRVSIISYLSLHRSVEDLVAD